MIKTITLYQAKELFELNSVDNLEYVDSNEVNDDKSSCNINNSYFYKIIFKAYNSKQLYSFECEANNINGGNFVRTEEGPIISLYTANNNKHGYHVRVTPVKKTTITKQIKVIKYIDEDM